MATPGVADAIRMTEDEYLETLANSRRFEFSDGIVTAKRGPYMTQLAHVAIAEELAHAFYEYRREHGGFSGQTPTTNFARAESRLYRVPDIGYWAGDRDFGSGIFPPPSVAVEIRSPDQGLGDLRDKCRLYVARGVDTCWLVDPSRRVVEVFDVARDGETVADDAILESAAMPGFEFPVARLWAAIPG